LGSIPSKDKSDIQMILEMIKFLDHKKFPPSLNLNKKLIELDDEFQLIPT